MNDLAALGDLARVTRAAYAQEQQRFAKVLAQETQLRAELDRLDQMNRTTQVAEPAGAGMRAIGADVLWRGWLGRSKTALNLQLARVLAVKEHHIRQVRRAYGKVLVVDEMHADLTAKHRRAQQDKALQAAIDSSLFKDGQRRG